MNPVAILEVLEEGLLLFRRFLSVVNGAESAAGKLGLINNQADLYDQQLKSHFSLPGEEVYLFILGREILKEVLPNDTFTETTIIDDLVLTALASSTNDRTSNDTSTVIIDFAYKLGQLVQTQEDDFCRYCEEYIGASHELAVVEDPVIRYLQVQDGIPDAKVVAVASILSFPTHGLSRIWASRENDPAVAYWVNYSETLVDKQSLVAKSQTFVGYLLIGAQSMIKRSISSIAVTSGPDGMSLSLLSLVKPTPFLFKRERISDIRTVTPQMVQMVNIAEMQRRGYVETDTREWIRKDQAIPTLVKQKGSDVETIVMKKKPVLEEISKGASKAQTVASLLKQAISVVSKKGKIKT